jgi:hypothetical protein
MHSACHDSAVALAHLRETFSHRDATFVSEWRAWTRQRGKTPCVAPKSPRIPRVFVAIMNITRGDVMARMLHDAPEQAVARVGSKPFFAPDEVPAPAETSNHNKTEKELS